jgi:hypothetical protein
MGARALGILRRFQQDNGSPLLAMLVSWLSGFRDTLAKWRTPMALNWLDMGVIAAYLAGVTLFGLHFRREQQS